MVVVARTIIRLTAIRCSPQFIGERGRPFFPGKMPLRRQPDGEREGLCLPWLGKDRPSLIAGQVRQSRKVLRLRN